MKWFVILIATIMIGGVQLISSANKVDSEPLPTPQVLGASVTQESADPLLNAINDYRMQNGQAALQFSSAINQLVEYRISDMVTNHYYAHKSLDNSTYADLIDTYIDKSTVSCENLQLQNNQQIQEAVAAWSNSSSHKNCLLNPRLTRGAVISSYYDDIANGTDNSATYVFAFIGSN